MAQFLRPDSIENPAPLGWTATGGPGELHDCIDEITADDGDRIVITQSNAGVATLTDGILPGFLTGWILRVRAKRVGLSGALTAQFQQGGVAKGTIHSVMLTTSYATRTFSIPDADVALFTDLTDLKIILTPTVSATSVDISWVEVEIPDGAGGGWKLLMGG